ncbi:AraC family transcriptional regulator [Shinella sp.]|uniref:AraC family transcriptional regulator n=1 Tax=Shinella sp. TaxID=1870904 RepID=UPI002587C219|nr:AraC family transcriptional regulator [Shinella sp.]MCW5706869.1 AraC family transcriptional regulator [Shinella sp.]
MKLEDADFEKVAIPPGHTVLWRMDDYPWPRSRWNYHPEFELHLIRHSSGLAYVGDHIGSFTGPQLFLVGSYLPHNWITPVVGDTCLHNRDVVVQFDPKQILSSTSLFPEFGSLDELFRDAALGLDFFGETAAKGIELIEEMGRCDGAESLAILLRFLAMAGASREYRKLASANFALRSPESTREAEILDVAINYINNNFANVISMTDIAELVGMPVSSFSRLFKNKTGVTYSDHISALRILTARRYLSETDLSVTEICFEAGFNNISNFNRTFLRATGLTPTMYRHAARARTAQRLARTVKPAAVAGEALEL